MKKKHQRGSTEGGFNPARCPDNPARCPRWSGVGWGGTRLEGEVGCGVGCGVGGWGGVGGECTHGRLQVSPFQHLMFAFNLPFLHLFFTYYSTFFSPFALPPVPNKNYLGGY